MYNVTYRERWVRVDLKSELHDAQILPPNNMGKGEVDGIEIK